MLYGWSGRTVDQRRIQLANFIPLTSGQDYASFKSKFGLDEESIKKYFFKDNIFAEQLKVLPDTFEFRVNLAHDVNGVHTIRCSHLNFIKNMDLAIGEILGMEEGKDSLKAKGVDPDVNIMSKFLDNYRFGLYKVGTKAWKATLDARKEAGYISEDLYSSSLNEVTDANPIYFWWIPIGWDYYVGEGFASADNIDVHGTTSDVDMTNFAYRSPTAFDGFDFSENYLLVAGLFVPVQLTSTIGHFEFNSVQLGPNDGNGIYHPGDNAFQDLYSISAGMNLNEIPNLPDEWVDLGTLAFDNKILQYMNYGSLISGSYLAPRVKHFTPEIADIVAKRCKGAVDGFGYLKSSSTAGFTRARMDVDFNAIDDIINVGENLGIILDPTDLANSLLILEKVSFVPDSWVCTGSKYTGSGERETLSKIFNKCRLFASGSIQSVILSDITCDLTVADGAALLTITHRDGTTVTIRNELVGAKNCNIVSDGSLLFAVYYLSVGSSLIGTLIDIAELAIFTKKINLSQYIYPTSLDFDKSGMTFATASPFRLRKFLTKV